MRFEVTGRNQSINFGARGVDEVLQNVAMILTTPKGTVPLRRDWFVNLSFLSTPTPAAQVRVASEIFQAIRRHEPRARIVGPVRFIQSDTEALGGRIIPAVTVEVVL